MFHFVGFVAVTLQLCFLNKSLQILLLLAHCGSKKPKRSSKSCSSQFFCLVVQETSLAFCFQKIHTSRRIDDVESNVGSFDFEKKNVSRRVSHAFCFSGRRGRCQFGILFWGDLFLVNFGVSLEDHGYTADTSTKILQPKDAKSRFVW